DVRVRAQLRPPTFSLDDQGRRVLAALPVKKNNVLAVPHSQYANCVVTQVIGKVYGLMRGERARIVEAWRRHSQQALRGRRETPAIILDADVKIMGSAIPKFAGRRRLAPCESD